MVDESLGAIALISIHPRFAHAILDGTKRVEFRKVAFKRRLTHIFLYATAPIQQVIGYVEVDAIEERSPAELWRRYHRVAGIGRAEFFAYYTGKKTGFALKVSRPLRLVTPLALDVLHRGATPPQSFMYIDSSALRLAAAYVATTTCASVWPLRQAASTRAS